MTPGELRIWEHNISRVWAEEVLRDRGNSLNSEDLHKVVWLATGDRKRADKERARRILEESRRQG